MDKFRLLRADEIDVRVATSSEKGASLLLYKDARCDMNILDETVGAENWTRQHLRDNANCIVSIWDSAKAQWISKEDTGTESNTEKEKGLASDSFKRACFNWGIGRELYTAPFIWVTDFQRDDKGKPRDSFTVETIGYDSERRINQLSITNRAGKTIYTMGNKSKSVKCDVCGRTIEGSPEKNLSAEEVKEKLGGMCRGCYREKHHTEQA